MTHRQSAAASRQPAPQLLDIACSFHGWAMENKMPDCKTGNIIVKIDPVSSTNYKAIIRKARESEEGEAVFRSDMQWHEQELDINVIPPNTIRCLVVGFACRTQQDEVSKQNKLSGVHPKSVGTEKPSNTFAWNDKEPPLLVVTPITADKIKGVKLYALLTPRDECKDSVLCKGYGIAQDFVFYLAKYRGKETSSASRISEWNVRVTKDSIRPEFSAPEATTKEQEYHKRARREDPALVKPNQSLANEAVKFSNMCSHSKDIYYLEETKRIFEALDPEVSDAHTKNRAMHKFINTRTEFSEQDAKDFVYEIQEQHEYHPHLAEVKEETVKRLRTGLEAGGVKFPYKLLYGFVRMGTRRMVRENVPETPAGDRDLARNVADDLMVVWPELESMPSIRGAPELALI